MSRAKVIADLRLTTLEMARFAAEGALLFPALIDPALGEAYIAEARGGRLLAVPAGTPLGKAYPPSSAIHAFVQVPKVAAIIESLVGANPTVDHHFPHITFSPAWLAKRGRAPAPSQHWHQDSTIDTRPSAFDIQLMWFPHEVTPEMGGTRYLPGSHLRIVSEAAIGRYQNIAGQKRFSGPAGTVLALHHGIWHGAGANRAQRNRFMFKLRLNPTVRQERLWNTADLPADNRQSAIFQPDGAASANPVHAILCAPQPWFEADTERLEYINRIRFWRHLTGDPAFDADYWLSRIENEPTSREGSERRHPRRRRGNRKPAKSPG